jgi:hypothetical protein
MNVSNSSVNSAYAAATAAFSRNDKAAASATLARVYDLDKATRPPLHVSERPSRIPKCPDDPFDDRPKYGIAGRCGCVRPFGG